MKKLRWGVVIALLWQLAGCAVVVPRPYVAGPVFVPAPVVVVPYGGHRHWH
ncbi:hypothetical protein [Undibacterium luofuense]|uniref:Uncharacterized protein n=1 Tax=Undibacterium luofuense TaxID=2828733 RepID=A0A941DJR1_9BURK|nr:hypothetical protein [Undibacterium luofuense]MBR7782282.1 hypothetical protein [Undibacterium luofuense]